jgi:antibiotic biosynthesis monooxygenase (ABM) superfamily enzyme
MRALKIVCGIAVLLVAFHMVHGIQHFVGHIGVGHPGMWALVATAVVVDVLAFVGGVLLLRRS